MAVEHVLPDGRELFADVSFRVGEGAQVALVGPNGAGKTTLLRMVAGELDAGAGSHRAQRRPRRDAPVRRAPTSRRAHPRRPRALARPARRSGPPAERLRAAEARARRHRAHASSATPTRSRRGARPGGYAAEVAFDTAAVAVLGPAVGRGRGTGRSPRSRAASRSGSPWSCCCAAPTRCCCSTSPTTSSTCPASAGWRTRLRRVGQERAVRQPRPRAARPHRAPHAGGHRCGGRGSRLDAPGRLRVLARGARRPARPARRAAPPLGRGAGQAGRLVVYYKDKAALQRRHGLALQAARTRLAQVPGGRAAAGEAARAEHPDAARRRAHRQARGGVRAAGARRPDLPVRPRGLVRRPGRRAGRQRHRQVALPAPARPRRHRPGARRGAGERRGARGRWRTSGIARLGARVRPGHFSQTHDRPELAGPHPARTSLVGGDASMATATGHDPWPTR